MGVMAQRRPDCHRTAPSAQPEPVPWRNFEIELRPWIEIGGLSPIEIVERPPPIPW